MQCVSVNRKRADGNVVLFKGVLELIKLCFVSEKLCRVTMCLAGISACTYLNGGNALLCHYLECLVKTLISIKIDKYA